MTTTNIDYTEAMLDAIYDLYADEALCDAVRYVETANADGLLTTHEYNDLSELVNSDDDDYYNSISFSFESFMEHDTVEHALYMQDTWPAPVDYSDYQFNHAG